MPTILTASGTGNAASLAAGNDGTFVLQTGPDGAKVNALSFDAAGIPTFLKVPLNTAVQSMVRLNTANGYGSTNTRIRRFTNTVTNQGTDITYADSASLGALFTINANGVYSISFNDQYTAAATLGISLNTTSPTSTIITIPLSEVLSIETTAGGGYTSALAWTGYLPSGSLIRPHCDSGTTGGGAAANFTITRVA